MNIQLPLENELRIKVIRTTSNTFNHVEKHESQALKMGLIDIEIINTVVGNYNFQLCEAETNQE